MRDSAIRSLSERNVLGIALGRGGHRNLLPETAEAPAFADNDKIASYAAEAVYLLQKAGIVTGSEGRFNPTATASRGELCKMLSGLMVSE